MPPKTDLKTTKKLGPQVRSFTTEVRKIDEEARTVEVAFSSEEPYERWWGIEILDHSPGAVDLSRLNNGGAALQNHRPDNLVGVVEKAEISGDRVGRALVRFGKSARAEEEWQDVRDGIRRHLSVGYRIHEAVLEKTGDDGDTYRVTKWEPYEISFVSIPADPTVGVGRSETEKEFEVKVIQPKREEKTHMPPEDKDKEKEIPVAANRGAEDLNHIRVQAADEARRNEQSRIREIMAIGEKHKLRELAEGFIKDGKSPDDFRRAVLDEMDRPKVTRVPDNAAEIGMSEKEVKRYSLIRAINAMVSKDWSKAGLELEASRAVGQKLGKEAQGFFLPFEVQMKNFNLGHLQRDLTVGTTTAGGHTVATNLLAGSFIELLRNKMVTLGLGAQMLSGLIGNIAIPRATGGATAYWVSEGSAPTESQQAFDQVTMSPKTVGAFTDISRKLLLQSSIDIDSFVMNDLSTILAIEIDRVGINGSASGAEPRGILNTSGIGAVVGGTHGAAPDEADIIDLETEVAIDNALLGTLAYLTNTKVRGKLKKTPIAAEHPDKVWDSRSPQTPLNGYRAEVTNQVPSNLTKGDADGVCSAIIFGNFNDLIYGQWGGLDIMQDPYTSSTTGTVRIVALQDVDVAVRHPQSFAAMKDALTA